MSITKGEVVEVEATTVDQLVVAAYDPIEQVVRVAQQAKVEQLIENFHIANHHK